MPRVRLVVVNFNGGSDVVRCVSLLCGLEWPDLEVVVVDNASTDGSADAVLAACPDVRLIRQAVNEGFPANNRAFDSLEAVDYVGLVNSDAFVPPGYLAPLVAALDADPQLGAACPKIVFAEQYVEVEVGGVAHGGRLTGVRRGGAEVGDRVVLGTGWTQPDDLADPRPIVTGSGGGARLLVPVGEPPDATVGEVAVEVDGRPVAATVLGPPVDVLNNVGNELTPTRYGVDRGFGSVDAGQFDSPEDVFAWCGAAVLFPAAYLRDVGGFDERLFLYYEDLDLAWRGRERGWRYRTVPASVVRHRLGATSRVGSPLFRYHTERNRLVVLAKHERLRVVVGAGLRYLLATASYARRDLLRRRSTTALVWLRLRSFAGFVRLLPHALRSRRRDRRGPAARKPLT